MGFRAALFDMDGVVIDTYDSVVAFWDQLAAERNIALTDALYTQHIIGTPAAYTLDVVFSQLDAAERQATLDNLHRYEAQLQYVEMPGVTTFLRRLKAIGIPTALVTSAFWPKVNDAFTQLGLDGLFTAVVTAADVPRGKPHPDGYLRGAEVLGIPPEACIVFEDALPGVRAAAAAGATPVGIARAGTAELLLELGARATVPDFRSITVERDGSGTWLRVGPDFRLPLDLSG